MSIRALAVSLAAGFALIAQESAKPDKHDAIFYDLEKEAALGKQLVAEFRRQTISIENPNVLRYLDKVGQMLAPQMPEVRLPFTFSAVVDDPCPATHEPAAFPGGYLFVPSALFLAAQEEAEFAGVLAHAMAHVTLRHGTRRLDRVNSGSNSSVPLIFLGGWAGRCSAGPANEPLSSLRTQRADELEADLRAVQTAARAGFDPEGLVRYIQRVQPQAAGTASKATSALPDCDDRVAGMLSIIKQLSHATYAVQSAQFAAVQQEVREQVRRLPERQGPSQGPPSLRRKPPE